MKTSGPTQGRYSPRLPLRRARLNSAEMPSPLFAGVCAGLAVHLGVAVGLVRIAMVLLSSFFGAGILLYLWLMVTVPLDDLGSGDDLGKPVIRLRRPLSRVGGGSGKRAVDRKLLLAGGILLACAVLLVVSQSVFDWSLLAVLAGVSVIGGIALVWTQVAHISQWKSSQVWVPAASGLGLIFLGGVLFFGRGFPPQVLLYGAAVGLFIMVVLVIVFGPVWFGMVRDMTDARSREARETERADIAAHLHDSVLQTLTLIRASAGDPVRVRALSLTQERELRAWLYTGHEDPGKSVARILRDRVAATESTYGIEVQVVTVGDVAPGPAELAAVAAVGEATANALRHGAPPISVYLEVRQKEVEIFVKDAGPGFLLEDVPEDRHGVRNSILGRIERVGGTASIRSRAEGIQGTEVHIRIPRVEEEIFSEREMP